MSERETRAPRPGEELDPLRLHTWISKAVSGIPDDATMAVTQFPGGHSNLTYLVTASGREMVLRRPPFGSKVKTAHDMGREWRILSALAPIYPKAPTPIALCEDERILGCKFYLMERRRGVILRKDPPAGVTISADTATLLGASLVDALVELHGIDPAAAGLADFGHPDGYVERQVSGWTKRWADAKTEDIPEVEEVAGWLAANLPASPAATIIHNDFKFDNLMLDAKDLPRIVAVLDWEMSTIGDPLMDLGTALCYWIEAGDGPEMVASRFVPTHLPGMPTRRQIVARYAEKTGRDLGAIDFYYKFGLFKTAVVGQQIYYRWKQGLTTDERFGQIIHGVRALARHAITAPSLR